MPLGNPRLGQVGNSEKPHYQWSSPDPVRIAAEIMVARLFQDNRELRKALTAKGVALVVEVPAAAWVEPITDALLAKLAPPIAESGELANEDEDWLEQPTLWSACRSDPRWRAGPAHCSMEVARWLSSGRNVLGVSACPARQLPKDLLRAADWKVSIPSIDPKLLLQLGRRLTGGRAKESLPPMWCRLIGPEDLHLARRPFEGADKFISRLRRLVEPRIASQGLTLDDLHGMDAAVAWGKALAIDIKEFATGRLPWSAVDKGVLLTGPPGTGKTTYAQALAETCGVPLIAGSLARWQAEGHLGDLLKAMRATFDEARRAAPSILFVDEIDAFGDRASFRHEQRDYSSQVVNGFLEELDGVTGREGVIVVGACNLPDRLDPAIVRSGRLDRVVDIPLPDQAALAGILRHYLGQNFVGADLTLAATLAMGHTGADCERWVRAARRRARSANREMMIDDLVAEIRGAVPVRRPELLRRCAVHEAGHAVALVVLRPGTLIGATVRETLTSGGGVMVTPDEEVTTREDILLKIGVLLAGRAAEEMLLGSVSTGAGGTDESDLAKATVLATSMSTAYGMDDQRGLVWTGCPSGESIEVQLRWQPDLHRRVAALLAQEYSRVLEVLREHEPAVDQVATLLAARETIGGLEIEAAVRDSVSASGRRLLRRSKSSASQHGSMQSP